MFAWAQEKPINESSNQARQILCRSCWATLHRPVNPVLPTFEAKERSQSWQRYQSFNRWNVLCIWIKRVLERYPLWIADDRQNTESAIFFTLGGWGVYQLQGELTTDWLIHYIGYQGKPVDGNIPLLAPQAKYFYEAEFFTLLIYQQTAILKRPENAEEITRKGKITKGW